MEIKDLIKFLEDQKTNKAEAIPPHQLGINSIVDEIISLLQEGKKYREMWEELYAIYITGNLPKIPNDVLPFAGGVQRYVMNFMKQKYFQKETKRCNNIQLLKDILKEFVKSEHSYYIERFMKVCIKLFKEETNKQGEKYKQIKKDFTDTIFQSVLDIIEDYDKRGMPIEYTKKQIRKLRASYREADKNGS